MDKPVKETLAYLQEIADRLSLVLNPDQKALDRIVSYMIENQTKHGKLYCPCKQHYPLKPESDPTCPCDSFRDEIKQNGYCECHLFFDASKIADTKRRPGLLATVTCPG